MPRVGMTVESPFRRIELVNKSFADWMGVEVAMPGRFNREPELGTIELE